MRANQASRSLGAGASGGGCEENDDAAVLAPDNGLPPSDAPVAGGPKLKHGSEEYKHLLPDREGGIVALHGIVPIALLHLKPKLPHELSGPEA